MTFAARTSVPVGITKGEIEKLLRGHGADGIALGYDAAARIGVIHFRMSIARRLGMEEADPGWRLVRIHVPVAKAPTKAKGEQIERTAWRMALLLVKAKMEAVSAGAVEFEREFLAHIVTSDNATVGERLMPQLSEQYAGRAPAALLLGPGSRP